jgi:hypothetical protein
MKVLLPAYRVIELRPCWTVSALERLVGYDGMEKSLFHSPTFEGRRLYDMDKVIAAEGTEEFRKFQTRRKK